MGRFGRTSEAGVIQLTLPAEIAQRIVAGEPFFFLLGAGASVTADIPTDIRGEKGLAWLLAISDTGDLEEARRKFGTDILVKDLFPTIDKDRFRRLLLRQNWQALGPTRCHDLVARLHLELFQVEVATTNYDPLCETAFRRFEVSPKVVCSEETLHFRREGDIVVYKIHLLVTEADLASGRYWVKILLQDRMLGRQCVYVGFSGNAEYILDSVRETVEALGDQFFGGYAVDKKPSEEVFAAEPQTPVGRFLQALRIPRENYSSDEADAFFEQVGNGVTQIILNHQLSLAAADVTLIVGDVTAVVDSVRTSVINTIGCFHAYDFVQRLEAAWPGFRSLNGARDSLRSAFRCVLVLIASGIY